MTAAQRGGSCCSVEKCHESAFKHACRYLSYRSGSSCSGVGTDYVFLGSRCLRMWTVSSFLWIRLHSSSSRGQTSSPASPNSLEMCTLQREKGADYLSWVALSSSGGGQSRRQQSVRRLDRFHWTNSIWLLAGSRSIKHGFLYSVPTGACGHLISPFWQTIQKPSHVEWDSSKDEPVFVVTTCKQEAARRRARVNLTDVWVPLPSGVILSSLKKRCLSSIR